MKYASIKSALFGVLSTPEWLAEGIRMFPAGEPVGSPEQGYCRLNIIPSKLGVNLNSVQGIVIVEIYTPVGGGATTAAYAIADKLDKYFVGKQLGSVQLYGSSMSPRGLDTDTPTLCRFQYSVTFSQFGES